MNSYSKTFDVRWADLDPYQHVRHTAYYDYCTHTRFSYMASCGFDQKAVERIGVGPVLLREEGRFLREVTEGDQLKIVIRMSGMSSDGAKFRVNHDVFRSDGVLAAVVTADGGWLDVAKRRFGTPPDDMVAVFRNLEPHESFEVLADVRRGV